MKYRGKALLAALLVFVAVMLWPRSLERSFDAAESMAASATIFNITYGHPDSQTENFELEAGSAKGQRIGELLSEHRYHLTWGSLTGRDHVSNHTGSICLFNSSGEDLIWFGEVGELLLNGRVYRLDYWGSDRSTALCEDILAVLRE